MREARPTATEAADERDIRSLSCSSGGQGDRKPSRASTSTVRRRSGHGGGGQDSSAPSRGSAVPQSGFRKAAYGSHSSDKGHRRRRRPTRRIRRHSRGHSRTCDLPNRKTESPPHGEHSQPCRRRHAKKSVEVYCVENASADFYSDNVGVRYATRMHKRKIKRFPRRE